MTVGTHGGDIAEAISPLSSAKASAAAAVACGFGERGGGVGERWRATKAAAAACGGGMRLFSVMSKGTLRGR